ncbi:MAG: hypothetical protein IT381_20935 [Deltaproteobacteria bacterium]|nr:hypothetical protein [Deltaproteobacteria bacterium]
MARPFQLTLQDPFTSVRANSDAQGAIVALGTLGVNGFAAAVPAFNDHWYFRVPEWLGTYLGVTELRIYGHEAGHARVARFHGATATSIDMHFHWGVTHWEGALTNEQALEATAAGMNQGERDSWRMWSQVQRQRSWTYQESLSYFLHHFNQSFYVLGSALTDAAGARQGGDDVANYTDEQLTGRPMSRWSVGVPSLLAAGLSPSMWQAVYQQVRFLGWGERDAAPWRLSAGPVSFGMPHFEVLLAPRDRLVGGYQQLEIGSRVAIEASTHVGLDSGMVREAARVDVQVLPWLTVSPYGAVTLVGSAPIGGSADRSATVGGVGGVGMTLAPLANAGLPGFARGSFLSATFEYGANDAILQGIEHQPNGFRAALSVGVTLPGR